MIYQYTGQPGHGKTLHAIERLLEFKAKGRAVYACNIREFDYAGTGVEPMTPEDFINWQAFLPDGAVCLVDECYQHGMIPKRPPGKAVPSHVEALAVHRHRGIDFIFVCQSPDKQCDGFLEDLIEEHVHVRRRFGTSYVHLRVFDRYERNPEKANPLTIKRGTLPKKVFGTYKSTELDTTQRKIPWYYFAFAVGVPLVLFLAYRTFGGLGDRLGGEPLPPVAATGTQAKPTEPTGEGSAGRSDPANPAQYLASFTPRIPSQPWTAPAYDDALSVPREPPRIYCIIGGSENTGTCTCLTDQGTRYMLDLTPCRMIARHGQYEPFLDTREKVRTNGYTQYDRAAQRTNELRAGEGWNPSAMPPTGGAPVGGESGYGGVAQYGGIGVGVEASSR